MEPTPTTIAFTVPAVPVAQPRQRHRALQMGGKTITQNYTPKSDPVNAFKATVQMAAREAYAGPPLEGPLWVSLVFVMPRTSKPAWITKRDRPESFADWKAGRRVPHASSRNDRDNLMKSLQDALNGLLWKDDGLICAGPVDKWIAAADEQPHVAVQVAPLRD